MSPFPEVTLHFDVVPGVFYLPASPPPSPSLPRRCSFRWAHLRAYAFTVPSTGTHTLCPLPPPFLRSLFSPTAQVTAQIHTVREDVLITI